MREYIFRLPDIGEGLHEAEIVGWLVPEGSRVKENQDFVEVQTDKAIVEISSPVSGTLIRQGAAEGENVRVGDPLAVFSVTGGVGRTATPQKFQGEESDLPTGERTDQPRSPIRILAAPSVRKAARDAGIDLLEVKGSGKAGKILMKDLESHKAKRDNGVHSAGIGAETSLSLEETDGAYELEKIKGVRKVSFDRMTKAAHTAALCTGMDEMDVTHLVELRQQLNDLTARKLTYLPFIVKAAARALRLNPVFNATVDEEKMELKKYRAIHIGIATATEEGLLVPVVRHADRLTIGELAAEIERLSEGARSRKLGPTELTGSTFTVSSTGGSGGFYATPIVNFPEVAILGVHAIKKRPAVVDDEIVIRQLMGMSLTFDHRVIDGEPAGKFMNDFKSLLEQPELFVLQSV
ncbi:dihydrolipoamide acetyltransferase family protein [Bhargavaea beijingensis]|uniref:dihydrolipoamide acetyltransferase family protein n=1 Tax=Bhargavaea beijingensis TaxID=426756 RepID=UPI002224150A|nr:dihydrolipoamide acetyltransferase family protein [Bhargavaea beijingensis]MCW1927392.1 2-oxo acid dehydrogenase subunit E2 [Bhargavaea beijingensis]